MALAVLQLALLCLCDQLKHAAKNYTKNKYLHCYKPLFYRLQTMLYHVVPYLKIISGVNLKFTFFILYYEHIEIKKK